MKFKNGNRKKFFKHNCGLILGYPLKSSDVCLLSNIQIELKCLEQFCSESVKEIKTKTNGWA